jgi:hypothetical protein
VHRLSKRMSRKLLNTKKRCAPKGEQSRLPRMVHSVINREAVDGVSSARDAYMRAYRVMLLARVLDDKLASLWRMGKIHGGVFLGRGQEALSVSLGMALRKGDIFAPLIRDGAGRLAFGEPLLDAVRSYLGSRLSPSRGRDGNIHRGRPKEGLLAMISHLGAMISVVNGALLAHRFQGITGTVGGACAGDGATSTGSFHEAVNQAAVERLPLVLVVEQLLRLLHPHRTPIRLPLAAGQGRRLWHRGTIRGRNRFVGVSHSNSRRGFPGQGGSRTAIGRGAVIALVRPRRTRSGPVRRSCVEGFARRPGLFEGGGRTHSPFRMGASSGPGCVA